LHQLAQKSTSTYFPLKELRLVAFPERSGSVKSGATWPIFTAVIFSSSPAMASVAGAALFLDTSFSFSVKLAISVFSGKRVFNSLITF